MPDDAERSARRRAVTLLRVGAGVCAYAARQIGDGLSPEQARQAAADAAAQLEVTAARLRQLTRLDLDAAGRRALAVQLSARGWSRGQIAQRIGVTPNTVTHYLRQGAD